jgi:hypothetical protein
MIYFPEYTIVHPATGEVVPRLQNKKWYIGSEEVTLRELGEICDIDEEELSMLRLTYG